MHHDGEVAFFFQFVPVCRFAMSHVALAFLLYHFFRYSKSYRSIETSAFPTALGSYLLFVSLSDSDLISQKSCRFVPRMSDERFCFREFQLEFFLQVRSDLLLEFFCLRLRAIETQ